MMTIQNTIEELRQLWGLLFDTEPSPSDKQFAIWIARFGAEITRQGIAQAAIKYQKAQKMSEDMSTEHIHRFSTAAMNRISDTNVFRNVDSR